MNDLQSLEQQIQQRLKKRDEQEQAEQRHLQSHMAEIENRSARFEQLADDVIANIVRPRMQKLVEFFENGELVTRNEAKGHLCTCRFDHSARYPASVTLRFSVAHDAEIESLLVLYDLEILPIFFQFERQDQLLLAFDDLDQEQIADWVNQRILVFVDTYLRLEQTDQYQRISLVTDPVCRMRFRKSIASAETEYAGDTYYFCSPGCYEKFIASPQQYISA